MADGKQMLTAEDYENLACQQEEKCRKYHAIILEVVVLFLRHGLQVGEANTVLDGVERAINCSTVAQHEE